ncbi:hypothetical protein [Nostoc sp.]|uniref:hypothetical protein n=1 Tax=Nostoc sp. TaxID=1180 RepID=UPI002FF7F012
MLVYEFKAYGKSAQLSAIDDAIRTAKFIRNRCIRLWMDLKGTGKNDLQKYCAVLAANFPFADELNSMARQASAERAWSSISRFFENCKKGITGKKGFPQFQKDCRSVEYKTSGWKLADDRKNITFTDKKKIGRLKLKGTRSLVKKTLSTRTHVCRCGCVMDRDENAARIILSRGLGTVGHTGTFALDVSNAWGDEAATPSGATLIEQVMS